MSAPSIPALGSPPKAVANSALASWLPIALCFLLGAGLIAQAVISSAGFPLDDSWIHQVVGRNAARFGIPGFLPGVPSSGSSSAIWPWIIAVNHRFLPGIPPHVFMLVVNGLLLCGIVTVLHQAAQADRLPSLDRLSLLSLPLLFGNVMWLMSAGMEHLLFVLLVLAGGTMACRQHPSHRALTGAGLLMGLAITTRPEGIVAAACCGALIAWRERKLSAVAAYGVPAALLLGLTLLSNYHTSRSLLPVTMTGRQWMQFGEVTFMNPQHMLTMARDTLRHLTVSLTGSRAPAVALLITALMALGVFRLVRLRARTVLWLLLLAGANMLAYAVNFPSIGHGMRYQALVLVFTLPLVGQGLMWGAEALAQRLPLRQALRRAAPACALLMAAGLGAFTLHQWHAATRAGIAHINDTHVRLGRWLAAHAGPNEAIATFDVGAIGYFSERRVTDLGGLVDPDFIPYLFEGRTQAYLRLQGVQLLVVPSLTTAEEKAECENFEQALRLCSDEHFRKTVVTQVFSEHAPWWRGMALMSHAARGQILYRIDW